MDKNVNEKRETMPLLPELETTENDCYNLHRPMHFSTCIWRSIVHHSATAEERNICELRFV